MPKKRPRFRRPVNLERTGARSATVTVVPAGMVRIDDPEATVVNVIPARPLDVEPLYGVG